MVVASDPQQSNLTKARIAAEHRSPNRICQVAPIFTPHLIHGSLDQHESATKRHLDRSSRSAQPTHVFSTPTTLRAMSVAIARIEHCAQLAMPAKSQHSLMTYDCSNPTV